MTLDGGERRLRRTAWPETRFLRVRKNIRVGGLKGDFGLFLLLPQQILKSTVRRDK